MSTFVLVHGSWHGGWCWNRLVPLLKAGGHVVIAPDLPGMGDDHTPLATDVAEQWTAWGVALVRAQSEPVILVAHSAGGQLASSIAEGEPAHVARVVFIAGALLADGQSRYDLKFGSNDLYAAIRPSVEGRSYSLDPAMAPGLLYGSASSDVAELAATRLVPEPTQPAIAAPRLTAERFGRVPRAYIETISDRAVPLALQRAMQQTWPCDPVFTMDSDHSPMLSAPDELATVLGRIASSGTSS